MLILVEFHQVCVCSYNVEQWSLRMFLRSHIPGSMPPHSRSLEEEGAMIIAFKLVEKGKFMEDDITKILMSPGKVSSVIFTL